MKIAICTFARSEYGLLKSVIRHSIVSFDTWLIAGAGHLSERAGLTIMDIYDDAIIPAEKIIMVDFIPDLRSGSAISASISSGLTSMASLLEQHRFDAVVIMGDRYELFTVTISALLERIPVVHISGGEITEGAIDDSIRHSTTKLSHLHLVANSECALNVSRMGEEDWRIVITGEPGIDNIHQKSFATDKDIFARTGFDISFPTLLVTLHPSTLEVGIGIREQYTPLLEALECLGNYQIIITAPGAEEGSPEIMAAFEEFAEKHVNVTFVPHLGSRVWLAVMRKAVAVVSNSSSGLVEAPSLGVATVNIGNRQKNRMTSESVINCSYSSIDIIHAIVKASSPEHKELCKRAMNPYDPYRDGKNSLRVVKAIMNFLVNNDLQARLVKRFDTEIKSDQWNTLLKNGDLSAR